MLTAHLVAFLIYVDQSCAGIFVGARILRISKEHIDRVGQKLFNQSLHALVVAQLSVDIARKIEFNGYRQSEIIALDVVRTHSRAGNVHYPRLHILHLVFLIFKVTVEERSQRFFVRKRSESAAVAVIETRDYLIAYLYPLQSLFVFRERIEFSEQVARGDEIFVGRAFDSVVEIILFAEFSVYESVSRFKLSFFGKSVHAKGFCRRELYVSDEREEVALRKVFGAQHIDDRLYRFRVHASRRCEVYRDQIVYLDDSVVDLSVYALHEGNVVSLFVGSSQEFIQQLIYSRLLLVVHIVDGNVCRPRLFIGIDAGGNVKRFRQYRRNDIRHALHDRRNVFSEQL